MSQYSEMMGSFIRTGNYPMEAHYVFPTESALKEFYNDPINATTIHKGLFRIVENGGDGNQALYWAVQDGENLKFEKLIENLDVDNIDQQLSDIYTKLQDEINARKEADKAIWGTNDQSNVPEELNSLYDLSIALSDLIQEVDRIHKELIDVDDSNYKSLKTELKNTVGTQRDDIIPYLQELPYKSLTELSNELNKFINTYDELSNQINTLPELKAFLNGYKDSDTLKQVLLNLKNDILGSPTPTADFRTLRAIEDFIRILKADSENTDNNIQSELDNTQIGVGLSGDGSYNSDTETYYLKDATSVMNALKILDSLVHQAISGITLKVNNTDIVDLNVRKELEGYVIGAKLNLSNVIGNDLLKKEDGLYLSINSTYNNGILSLYANDKLVAQHILGFSSIVESAYYDPLQESVIIVFKLLSGEKQTITIPVGTLIRELVVDNNQPGKVVELTRETVIDGPDKLSADVRIYNDKHNILKKIGNTLSVDGTSDSITHYDKTLSSVIDEIETNLNETTNKLNAEISRAESSESDINEHITQVSESLQEEITRATEKESSINEAVIKLNESLIEKETTLNTSINNVQQELTQTAQELRDELAPIDSPIFTGVPQVEVSPDENDSSQRIPSTNWVNNKVNAVNDQLTLHINNKENPHNVTAEQINTYTKEEIDEKLNELLSWVDVV